MKRVLPAFILFAIQLHATSTISQTKKITSNPLLEYLYHTKNSEIMVRLLNEQMYLPYQNYKEQKVVKTIIKNKTGLFTLILGTGQVFKVIEANKQEVTLQRIDSTIFFGNNFFSFDFSYKDTIFSFGGYGFWRFNGQLRYFTNGGEWNVHRLNQEIALNSELIFLNEKQGCIYYLQTPIKQETTNETISNYSVYKLNIKLRTNEYLGSFTHSEILLTYKNVFAAPALGGLVLQNATEWNLLDLEHNRIYKLTNKRIIDWLMPSSSKSYDAYFMTGNKLFSYSRYEDNLRSIEMSMRDFQILPNRIYHSKKIIATNNLLILLMFCVILIPFATFFIIKKLKTREISYINDNVEFIQETENGFTKMELILIDAIISKYNVDSPMSVVDLNHLLGLSKKSLEVQKKTRREVLNKINQNLDRSLNKTQI